MFCKTRRTCCMTQAQLAAQYRKSWYYSALQTALAAAGVNCLRLEAGREPLLSKVNEGVQLCLRENIQAVVGIGGGVCMDLAKAIAFGACHADVPLEKYLTYELPTEGLAHLPVTAESLADMIEDAITGNRA